MYKCLLPIFLLASSTTVVLGAELDIEKSRKIISDGEVLATRHFLKPKRGWEMLIRKDGQLYVCTATLDKQYGFNGAPHEPYVHNDICIGQLKEK